MGSRDAGRRAIILALCLLIGFLTGGMPTWAAPSPSQQGVPPGKYTDHSKTTPPGSYSYKVYTVALRAVQVDPDDITNALTDYQHEVASGTDQKYIDGLPLLGDLNAPRDQWLRCLKTAALARYARYQVNLAKRKAEYPQKLADYQSGKIAKRPPKPPALMSWQDWLEDLLIGNEANRARGEAYHQWVRTTGRPAPSLGVPGKVTIPDAPFANRFYDELFPDPTAPDNGKIWNEIKANDKYEYDQFRKDKENAAFLADRNRKNGRSDRIRQTFGEKPSPGKVKKLTEAGIDVEYLPAKAQALDRDGNPVQLRPTAKQRKQAAKRAAAQREMSGPAQKPAQGALVDVVAASPNTAEDAAGEAPADPALDAEFPVSTVDCSVPGAHGQSLLLQAFPPDCFGEDDEDADAADEGASADAQQNGGIDFSTLELSYISDTDSDNGPGSSFAFQAKATADGQVSYGGLQAVQQASDSFFVWLALRPDRFTVNLNPAEPDRIVDHELGRTDAGRVMLEADLQLKKTIAKLIHPDTPLGDQYWQQTEGMDNESSCDSFRSWIVPAPATVREDHGQLYILNAPLDVKMETDYLQDRGKSPADIQPCRHNDPAVDKHNADVFRALILPKVVDEVNNAPEYQDLHRVYYSRIAAQWIRERSKQKTTAYSSIIDSGNINPWAAHTSWTPNDVYQRYLTSYRDHEFSVSHRAQRGNSMVTETYVFGGVDFSSVPRVNISPAAFQRDWSAIPTIVAHAQQSATSSSDGQTVWLGGTAAPDPERNGFAAAHARSRTTQQILIIVGSVVGVLVLAIIVFLFGPRWQKRSRRIAITRGQQ